MKRWHWMIITGVIAALAFHAGEKYGMDKVLDAIQPLTQVPL